MKLATAADKLVFMTSSTDHVTGATGLTLTITASKAGGAFAAITPTVTERGNGWYALALTASHTDTLGDLGLHITSAGADPTDLLWEVTPELPGQLAAGAITATKFGAAAITSTVVADDFITAGKLAIDCITASRIAAGAIDAATFAADVAALIRGYLGLGSANLDTQLSGISTKTTNLPTDPADQSAVEAALTAATSPLATAANLATVASYLDTEIADILADTNELQTDWHDGGRLDTLLDTAAGGGGTFYESVYGTSDTVVVCAAAASDILRAAALRTAVTTAASLSPSNDKRITVIVPPGRYDFATGDGSNNGLVLNTEFVDLQGATGNPVDVILTSQIVTSSRGTLQQTANDVRLSDFTTEIDAASGTTNSAYYCTTNLPLTKIQNVVFRRLASGGPAMRAIVYSGYYERCKAYGGGFGLAFGGATGVFIDCYAENPSYSYGFGGGGADASGRFIRCTNIGDYGFTGQGSSGYFEDCLNIGIRSFGGPLSTGIFKRCVNVGSQGFGGYTTNSGVASGIYTDCINLGDGGFGDTASGHFQRCVNYGVGGFGSVIACTGTFIECRGDADSFDPDSATAVFVNCLAGGTLLSNATDVNVAQWLGDVPKALTGDGRVESRSLPTQSTIGGQGFQFRLSVISIPDKLVSGEEVTFVDTQELDCIKRTTTYSPATTGSQWLVSVEPLSHEPVGADPDVTFSSSDPAIATVDGTGLVTYVSAGDFTITATSAETPISASQEVSLNLTNILTLHGTPYDVITYIPDALDATKHLLVLYNADSSDSIDLKDYYLAQRPGLSSANTLGITGLPDTTSTTDQVKLNSFLDAVYAWLVANEATKPIRYIVVLRGLPSRRYVSGTNYESVGYRLYRLLADKGYRPGTGTLYRHSEQEYNRVAFTKTTCLPTWIDCGSYPATYAYIDKVVAAAAEGLQPDGLTISGGTSGGDQWYLDDCNRYYFLHGPFFNTFEAKILEEGVSADDITYQTNTLGTPLTDLADPTFFACWGIYCWGSNWAITPNVDMSGHSNWWLGMSVESYNGIYDHPTHGDPGEFFAATAFSGTAYAHTPVGYVGHTDEPGLGGVSTFDYAGRWARGWNFAECAWAGENSTRILMVGDPLVTR